MKHMVSELVMVVTGNKNQTKTIQPGKMVKTTYSRPKEALSPKKGKLPHHSSEIKPDQVIPFDEEEFKDF